MSSVFRGRRYCFTKKPRVKRSTVFPPGFPFGASPYMTYPPKLIVTLRILLSR